MRPPRRSVAPASRRKVPLRSRLTVRREPPAPLARRDRLSEALRTSREAVSDLERQLDLLLAKLRSAELPRADDVDRLRRTATRAGTAVARLR
jgi:hypothetical protein